MLLQFALRLFPQEQVLSLLPLLTWWSVAFVLCVCVTPRAMESLGPDLNWLIRRATSRLVLRLLALASRCYLDCPAKKIRGFFSLPTHRSLAWTSHQSRMLHTVAHRQRNVWWTRQCYLLLSPACASSSKWREVFSHHWQAAEKIQCHVTRSTKLSNFSKQTVVW